MSKVKEFSSANADQLEVSNASENEWKGIYYNVSLHKAWILFLLLFITTICLIGIPWTFKLIYSKFPFLFPQIVQDGNEKFDFVPNFIAGLLGVILGFFFDAVFIRRLRIIHDYEGIRSNLIDKLKVIIYYCLKEDIDIKCSRVEQMRDDIKLYLSDVELCSTLYNLPRYSKLPYYFRGKRMKGLFIDLLGKILQFLYDAIEVIPSENNDKLKGNLKNVTSACLGLLMYIDNDINYNREAKMQVVEERLTDYYSEYRETAENDSWAEIFKQNTFNMPTELISRKEFAKILKKMKKKNESNDDGFESFIKELKKYVKVFLMRISRKDIYKFCNKANTYEENSLVYFYCGIK